MGNLGILLKGKLSQGIQLDWVQWDIFMVTVTFISLVIASYPGVAMASTILPSTMPALLAVGPPGAGLEGVSNINMSY